MNYMKNIFLIVLCLFAFNNNAKAEITVQEARDVKYIENHGHSPEMARLIDLQRKQINGISTQPNKKSIYTLPVRMFKKFQAYLDPAIDNGNFGNNKIHNNPSINDL